MGIQGNATNTLEKSQQLAKAHYHIHNRDRLPSLREVLLRKTAPPVCLFNFYLYMRDVEHASEYLDFYLDILTHEILCKAFVKDLKKLGLEVNLEYPEYEKYRPGALKMEKDKLKFSTSVSVSVRKHLSSSSRGSDHTLTPRGASDVSNNNDDDNKKREYRDSVRSNITNTTNATSGNLSFYNRERPFTRDDLRGSAERIYYKYIFEGADKEIKLSSHIREKITHAIDEEILQHKRDDPWIYYEAKNEIYALMEREHFPRFLKAKAFSNMNATQILIRLGIGLFFLFLGFATALSLIFLDIRPRTVRLWSFIPIFLGVKSLFTYIKKLSPLFVSLKISETTFFQFQRIMESFIYKLQVKRGIIILIQSLMVSIIITGIFVAVPGHRLYI